MAQALRTRPGTKRQRRPRLASKAPPRNASDASHRAVPAVTRAIAVLRLLGASEMPMGVNAIATRLNVVPSTALHILRALVREELVSFDQNTKQYALDAGILTLARSALRRGNFADRIQSSLERLARKHRVTLLAFRVVGIDHIVVLATCSSNLPLRLHVEVGSRFPALMSATGRCVAAFQNHPLAELKQRFNSIRWDDPPSFTKWLQEVNDARKNRYSIDRGNYLAGVTVVAAPVLDSDGIITNAIVAIGLNDQLTPEAIKLLAKDLKATAERFSGG